MRAVDAHGLDFSGLDERPRGSGGGGMRVAVLVLSALVLAALIILGIILL